MKVVVPAETRPGERRVSLVPDAVPRLIEAGLEVVVQAGAGRFAYAADSAYQASGATIIDGDPVEGDAVVLSVAPLDADRAAALRGATTLSFLPTLQELDLVRTYVRQDVTSYAMELVPRISRAQSMDALSSQALVAGYRSVLVAASRLPRFFPLFMTAAGTVPPAKVLVLGAGVAGLQAIATARRLGAIVDAYDVRAASADEIRSLGANFVELGLDALEGTGGYAREMGEQRAERQRELLAPFVAAADVVITTAAVPGRPAPLLVTTAMVEGMRAGAMLVDLAAESGGNCELSRPGEDVVHGEVLVVGMRDAASAMPVDASRLYARNLVNLLLLMTKDGAVAPDFDDEILDGTCVTHAGEIRHAPTREALAAEGVR